MGQGLLKVLALSGTEVLQNMFLSCQIEPAFVISLLKLGRDKSGPYYPIVWLNTTITTRHTNIRLNKIAAFRVLFACFIGGKSSGLGSNNTRSSISSVELNNSGSA